MLAMGRVAPPAPHSPRGHKRPHWAVQLIGYFCVFDFVNCQIPAPPVRSAPSPVPQAKQKQTPPSGTSFGVHLGAHPLAICAADSENSPFWVFCFPHSISSLNLFAKHFTELASYLPCFCIAVFLIQLQLFVNCRHNSSLANVCKLFTEQ